MTANLQKREGHSVFNYPAFEVASTSGLSLPWRQDSDSEELTGVGLLLESDIEGKVRVKGFIPGGDALASGDVRVNDELIEAADVEVMHRSIREVRESLSGEEGTCVNLTLVRDGRRVHVTLHRHRLSKQFGACFGDCDSLTTPGEGSILLAARRSGLEGEFAVMQQRDTALRTQVCLQRFRLSTFCCAVYTTMD